MEPAISKFLLSDVKRSLKFVFKMGFSMPLIASPQLIAIVVFLSMLDSKLCVLSAIFFINSLPTDNAFFAFMVVVLNLDNDSIYISEPSVSNFVCSAG
jgi:hypothetical protein